MDILKFLFLLAIVHVVFRLIWHYVFSLPFVLLIVKMLDKGDRDWNVLQRGAFLLMKILGNYIYASLFVITVYRFTDLGWRVFTINALLGLLLLFTSLAAGIGRTQAEAARDRDLLLLKLVRFDVIIAAIACGYYIFAIFLPVVAHNMLTEGFLRVARWIYGIPLIGFVLGVYAVCTMVGFIGTGVLGGVGAVVSLFTKGSSEMFGPCAKVARKRPSKRKAKSDRPSHKESRSTPVEPSR